MLNKSPRWILVVGLGALTTAMPVKRAVDSIDTTGASEEDVIPDRNPIASLIFTSATTTLIDIIAALPKTVVLLSAHILVSKAAVKDSNKHTVRAVHAWLLAISVPLFDEHMQKMPEILFCINGMVRYGQVLFSGVPAPQRPHLITSTAVVACGLAIAMTRFEQSQQEESQNESAEPPNGANHKYAWFPLVVLVSMDVLFILYRCLERIKSCANIARRQLAAWLACS